MVIKGIISVICSLCICFAVFAKTPQPKNNSCSAHAQQGTVALTFDDGPSPVFTKKVMKILNHYHINATFFVVGEMVKVHPKFLKQMVADGDVIGNHSWTHPVVPKLKGNALNKEVLDTENIIYQVIGVKPHIFRFPYGAENKRVIKYVKSQGLIPVNWGYTPDDYTRPGTAVIAQRVISHARSGQVILLHDGPAKREQTVAALPQIIEGIKKKGLGFSVICS
jgi:peptidoglycan-N-acetylglucosamine deacetylase